MHHRHHRSALFALVFTLFILSTSAARVSTRSPPDGALHPYTYDPRDYTIDLPNEERIHRATYSTGGEISICCCYCGRASASVRPEDDYTRAPVSDERELLNRRSGGLSSDGVPSEDAWLYKPRRRQPKPDIGDPTYRLMRARRRRMRQQPETNRTAAVQNATASSDEGQSGSIAEFVLFRTVEQYCKNEYCVEEAPMCLENHIWTGWVPPTIDGSQPNDAVAHEQCELMYQREMDVLTKFEDMAFGPKVQVERPM